MAGNMYIKFEQPNIVGEATYKGHEKDVEVISWNHSFSQPTSPTRSSAGGATVEKANHSDFSFTKYIDSSTDDLLKQCWNGDYIDTVTFSAYRADGANQPVKYLEIVMERVVVSGYNVSGVAGDIAIENISLNYGIVTYKYKSQKEDSNESEGVEPVKHNLVDSTVE